jgi:hypothetical protein
MAILNIAIFIGLDRRPYCRRHEAFVEKIFPLNAQRYSPTGSANHPSSGLRNLGIARTSNPRNRMIKYHGSNARCPHIRFLEE